MAKKLNISKIAVVENMSGLICPHCGEEIDFFGTGGGQKMAEEMDVDFLGRVPMEKQNRECSDNGTPVVLKHPESASAKAFSEISEKVIQRLNS